MPAIQSSRSRLVLVCTPTGRDASIAAALLRDVGGQARAVPGLNELTLAIDDDTCLVVVAEEALRGLDLSGLTAKLSDQPTWSDLPFIILTQKGGGPERNPAAAQLAKRLGNVAFIERPFHPTTFTSLARTALKNRHRQYETRALIEKLNEGEERLRTALAAGRLGAWELHLSTQELITSDTCKAAFGRQADDSFTYAELMASIHPDDQSRMAEAVERTIALGVDYAIEYRNIWPDGSRHWVEVHARRVTDRSGSSRLVGVSQDITPRKEAERVLEASHEQLERRVAERTQDLEQAHARVLAEIAQRERTEEQLRQAQKMETIGQLTGGVAHDFNNLLMAVIGNLDLLSKSMPDDPRMRRLIEGAIQGASRGASLTQRLLAFARRQDLQLVPKDMTSLVRGVVDLLAKSVGPRIELRYELGERLKPALVDVNQVELALLNLVVNARDAMPDGGVVTIETDQVAISGNTLLDDGDYIRLAVSDSGQGMDAETLAKATEPFFSTKELGKGTGLGLSMIHGLALQLHGTLHLTSEVGAGTRAELFVPVTDVGVALEEPVEEPRLEPVSQAKTILVVDDDALIAMSTVDLLEDLGHTVIEVNSGAAALDVIESGKHLDLMITDYSMPKMTGGQLAASARKLRPALPILLATGYAELPADTDLNLPRLAKPYHQRQLADAIEKLFGHNG